jgi:hypothetical protein
MAGERQMCFVIMPFSETKEHSEQYWTDHFNDFLKPLIEENPNLEACRSEALRGDILRQIITNLVVAPIVVADLTDHNGNVYWELGIRQSFKHCTITIAEFGTKLPFDISGKGTLWYYPNNHLKMQNFRRKFKEAINDCVKNPDVSDSYVLETLSGRGTLFEIFRRDATIRRLDAVMSEFGLNKGILGHVVRQAKMNREISDKNLDMEFESSPIQLSISAIVLLITERYVDEDSSFFSKIQECVTGIQHYNGLLSRWHGDIKANEALIQNAKAIHEEIKDARTLVSKARDKVSKRF